MIPPTRLARREASPALIRLHRALSRLSGVLCVMNTGAHPDDEQSGLLAWLRFGLGHRVVVACSTRGEGGQNALGPERGATLAALRTREMEEAARVLDCDVAWLGFGPDDPVHDFGFSKDGDDTFRRWGRDRITARLAQAYRRYRPDVVIPTFLDVPGQHGHHRAMTRAAFDAQAAARVAGEGGAPWHIGAFYLPAWGGGGATYDDTEPPPPATLVIRADAVEPATGAPYDEIGEYSRARHASQGMGDWRDTPRREWALHLVGGGPEARLAEGLPASSLRDLAALAGPAQPALSRAAEGVAMAQEAFPDRGAILAALAAADAALHEAQAVLTDDFAARHGHRLIRKRREIAYALAEAAGLAPVAAIAPARLARGARACVSLHQPAPHLAQAVQAHLHLPGTADDTALPLTQGLTEVTLTIPTDAPLSPGFVADFDALGGNGAHVTLSARIQDCPVTLALDFEVPPAILPDRLFAARPEALVQRIGTTAPLHVTLGGDLPDAITAPPGWQIVQQGRGLTLTPPDDTPGLAHLTPLFDGQPAQTLLGGNYPHTGPFALLRPARISVLSLDCTLPDGARVGYIGAGDHVGDWLMRMGADVTMLEALGPDTDFSAFTTIIVGVMAYGSRLDLAAATPRLHDFVRAGGHLVTLYQRPDRGWDAKTTPPRPLTIGTPSLRWRVTDPDAPVRILAPDHPLLTTPNRITGADWQGWDKDRGLYFASRWDDCYQPLLAMSDSGEAALHGALISGRIGAGRHSHVALSLHHQMDRLVPGAFRLMANLIRPAG